MAERGNSLNRRSELCRSFSPEASPALSVKPAPHLSLALLFSSRFAPRFSSFSLFDYFSFLQFCWNLGSEIVLVRKWCVNNEILNYLLLVLRINFWLCSLKWLWFILFISFEIEIELFRCKVCILMLQQWENLAYGARRRGLLVKKELELFGKGISLQLLTVCLTLLSIFMHMSTIRRLAEMSYIYIYICKYHCMKLITRGICF